MTKTYSQVNVDSYKKYFLPIVKINNYDQPINDSIKQYDEVRKILTGKGDDYINGFLLDFSYFEKNYRIIAVHLSKQKALYADSRAIQQIVFTGKIKAEANNTRVIIFHVLQKSKGTILEFSKGTTKFL